MSSSAKSFTYTLVASVVTFGLMSALVTRSSVTKGPGMASFAAAEEPVKKKLPLKYIYLSFDDGPLHGSERIDSIVKAERIKISVFLVGRQLQVSKQLGEYVKMYEENPFVESYNHSYSHANSHYQSYYKDPVQVLNDIIKNEEALKLHFKIVRLPGRNIWRVGNRKRDDGNSGAAAADTLAAHGYTLYGWDLEWRHDPKTGKPTQTADSIARAVESRLEAGGTFTKDHIVLLIHDEMFREELAGNELYQLIRKLRSHENYVFEHLRFYPTKP